MGRRPKVVIGHPMMGRGGSESNVMWLLEALKQDCDVSVATTRGWDLDTLNTFYGTSVRPEEVRVRIAPTLLPARVDAAALRGALYQRFARHIAGEYDLRISADNPTDWGCPAVHFIADFSWDRSIREAFDPLPPGRFYRDSHLRRLYLKTASAIAQSSGRAVLHEDLVIANSAWSAKVLDRRFCLRNAPVVFPAVWSRFPNVAWERKEQAFVAIGRISPEKRVERIISILGGVRKRGHDIRLHLCGAIGQDAYGCAVAQLCSNNRSWVIAEGEVTGYRKARILTSCRFGIQARASEPFGIAVAEMVKAGAIVFTPGIGGQAEIVDHPALTFDGEQDAVERISRVIQDTARQEELTIHLAKRAARFSAETFVRESRSLIAEFFAAQLSNNAVSPKLRPGAEALD